MTERSGRKPPTFTFVVPRVEREQASEPDYGLGFGIEIVHGPGHVQAHEHE